MLSYFGERCVDEMKMVGVIGGEYVKLSSGKKYLEEVKWLD